MAGRSLSRRRCERPRQLGCGLFPVGLALATQRTNAFPELDRDHVDAPVSLEMRAGQISLRSEWILHGSLPNNSRRRRCGLTMRYLSGDVRAYYGWNQNSIVCRGVEPTGRWANHPRPDGHSSPPRTAASRTSHHPPASTIATGSGSRSKPLSPGSAKPSQPEPALGCGSSAAIQRRAPPGEPPGRQRPLGQGAITPVGRRLADVAGNRRTLQIYFPDGTNRCWEFRRGCVEYGYRSLTPAVAGVELPQPARRPRRPEPDDDAFPGGATDDRPEPLLGPDDSGCCGRCWFCRCSRLGACAETARGIDATHHLLHRCEGLR